MMRNTRSCILIATVFLAMNAPTLAQTAYPAKPIRMVVPFSPGGTSDTLARILGQKITEAWGQQMVVDSRPGASGRPRAVNRVPACGMRTSACRDARCCVYRGHSIRLRGRIP